MSRLMIFALVLGLCAAAEALAADVVDLIPSDAYGFVVVSHPAELDAKLQALGRRMDLPIPSVVSMVVDQAGVADGLDPQGSVAVALVPADEGPVTGLLFVAVSDYATFIESLSGESAAGDTVAAEISGQAVIIGERDGYAVVTWPNSRTQLQSVLSREDEGLSLPNLSEQLSGDYDVVGMVSPQGVTTLCALGQTGLQAAKAVVEAQVGEDNPAAAGLEVYVHLLNAISSEVSSAGFGLLFEETGSLRITELADLKPDGRVAPILRDLAPPERDLLAGLPYTPYVVAGGAVVPPEAMGPMMDFSAEMMKSMSQLYGLTDEQVDKMMDLVREYVVDVHGMSFLLGVGQGGDPVYSEMIAAMYVEDAQDYVKRYRAYFDELEALIGDAETSMFSNITVEDIQVDGTPALKITMPMQGFQDLMPGAQELNILEKMYGPDGLTIYVAPAGEKTVLMSYTGTALLERAMGAIDDPSQHISQERQVVEASRSQQAGALAAGYWSPTGTIDFAGRLMQIMAGNAVPFVLPPYPDSPPVAWSLSATGTVVTSETVVPAGAFEAAGDYVKVVKATMD